MHNLAEDKMAALIDRAALVFFAIMVFFLPISSAVIESCFGFIFVCAIIKGFIVKPGFSDIKQFFKDRINLSLFVFYIAIGISLFAAGPLWLKSFKAWFFKWGEGVLLFYFAQLFCKKNHVKMLLLVFIISAFLLCIDGFYQKYRGVDFLLGRPLIITPAFSAIRASFNHYNDFATFLIVMFFLNNGLLASGMNFSFKIFSLVLSLFIIGSLFFTYSRGAWLSFLLVTILIILFFMDKKTKIFLLLFLLIFISCILFIPSFKERLLFITKEGGDADRLAMWKIAFAIFKDSPFIGQGLGLFMDRFSRYNYYHLYIQYAHNCYLQIMAESGLLGLLSFFWFIFEIMRRSYFIIKLNNEPIFLWLFSAFCAYLLHSFFDTQLYSLSLAILFWLLAAFIVCIISSHSKCKTSSHVTS